MGMRGPVMRGRIIGLLVVMAGAFSAGGAVAGQRGALSGLVRDSSGAVVANATVTLQGQDSSPIRLFDTTRDGVFRAPSLPDGEYAIRVIAPGFAVTDLTIRVPSSAAIEVVLRPAPVVEAVQVVSASRQDELRETLNTSVATVNGQPQNVVAPAYALWDVYASQRVTRGLSVFGAVDNVTDSEDPNVGRVLASGSPLAIYRPEVGRTFRAGIRWSWAR